MDKNGRNSSIDLFRYLCAVLVVAIHTNPFAEINEELGYVCSQIIPRIAVPFFFAAAGYFYFRKLEKGVTGFVFLTYLRRLLCTYFVWSCVYFLIDFLNKGYLDIKAFLLDCAVKFTVLGSQYHFWFFPALIFAVCFTTLLYKTQFQRLLIPLSIVLYTAGCLGCSYFELGIRIPLLGELYKSASVFNIIRRVLFMGLPFFICGYIVYKIKDRMEANASNRKMLWIWGSSITVWLLEIGIIRALEWEKNIFITFGLFLFVITTLLVLLRNPLPQYHALSKVTLVLADFTYYSHPVCIMALTILGNYILHIQVQGTSMFFLTVTLTGIGGYCIYKWDNPAVNRIL